ncbi:toll-like receptor 8 [Seriola lalandi dorsalis]|uniref:toll-like receptor 8 n=1 Tax=Seriola lalandi dorsalis TaxID=1841481 RepID=UPI000C6F9B6B|nr:toll-like receptor 8 [Seriola lalandi dorsalis]
MLPQFPCDVKACNTSEVVFDCKGRHLHAVPDKIASNATELDLSENYIKNISVNSFSKLLNLTKLDLKWANKKEGLIIAANTFKNLTQLNHLILTGNCLTQIPSNLPLSVEILELNTNNITLLDNRSVAGLTNVTQLWLCSNQIQYISEFDFFGLYNLKTLKIQGNCPRCQTAPYPCVPCPNISLENRLHPIPVEHPPSPSDGYNQRPDLSISPLRKPQPKDFAFEISHSLIKEECFELGRVLILSSNNLFFISPEQFNGYGDIACLNLSRNGFSAALNGTEFSLLPNLTYLDLSFNRIDLAYDNAFKELKKLQVLDLSYNEHYFKAYGITHNLNFTKNLPVLRVLNMSHNGISTLTTKQMYSESLSELQFTDNNLGTLWKERDGSYKMLFTNLINLTILDISRNRIAKIPIDVYKYLPRNLTKLRISHNGLADFRWDSLRYFHQLQILDLSFNSLSNVTGINSNITQTLTFLDLNHNCIFQLDNGFIKGPKSLKTLSLSNNKLTTINQSTFQSRPDNQIQTLFLQGNPFQCTCDLLDFILWIEKSEVNIPRLTTMVTCHTPANQKGQALIYFDINQCVNDSQAFLVYIVTTSFIIAFMIVATVAHLFYWDASYVIHYMKAKLKGYRSLSSPDSVYDVFVTYDTRDPRVSEWVMRNLRLKLEDEGEKHLPLCLEERDWPPGVPLVENLTQSIRYSRKTLFVLTEGYVKTGVFKLAMYLAHQRLLDENLDVIVLLMLEPVLQHSHFLRLRRRLCGKSVVEWPRTAAAEPWFWQNLRNVVRVDNQVIYNKTYSKYFSSR